MEEEKQTEEVKEESVTQIELQPELSVIDKTELLLANLEEANKVQKELLDRKEMLMAKEALGGTSEAGAQPAAPVVLSDTEYSEAMLRGEVDPFKADGFGI